MRDYTDQLTQLDDPVLSQLETAKDHPKELLLHRTHELVSRHLKHFIFPWVEKILWRITSPKFYGFIAICAWMGVLFAPQLRSYYLQSHPELQQQVVAKVAAEWGQFGQSKLALQLNRLGGWTPHEVDPYQATGAMYLTSLHGEVCIGALVHPRIVLASAHCIDQIQPTFAFWGAQTGEDQLKIIAVERDPRGEISLLKLAHVAPMAPLKLRKSLQQLLSTTQFKEFMSQDKLQDASLQSGRSTVLRSIKNRAITTRDDLNVILFLPTYRYQERYWGTLSHPSYMKASLWVPQNSKQDPHARETALKNLALHESGSLIIGRTHALEGMLTSAGLIELSQRRDWILEASEALATRHHS